MKRRGSVQGRVGAGMGSGPDVETSHNSIPPSRPHLEAWEGWSVPVPRHLVLRNKRQHGEKADHNRDMPSAAELAAAIVMANANLVTLVHSVAATQTTSRLVAGV